MECEKLIQSYEMVIDDTWQQLQMRVKQLLTHASDAEKMLKDYEERLPYDASWTVFVTTDIYNIEQTLSQLDKYRDILLILKEFKSSQPDIC